MRALNCEFREGNGDESGEGTAKQQQAASVCVCTLSTKMLHDIASAALCVNACAEMYQNGKGTINPHLVCSDCKVKQTDDETSET